MRAAIARILELRADAGRADEAFDLGINTEPIHLGDPGWNVGKHTLTGAPEPIAERLRSYGQLGANQLQVRFRSRSVAELCDQIDAGAVDEAALDAPSLAAACERALSAPPPDPARLDFGGAARSAALLAELAAGG